MRRHVGEWRRWPPRLRNLSILQNEFVRRAGCCARPHPRVGGYGRGHDSAPEPLRLLSSAEARDRDGNRLRVALYARCSTKDKGQDPETQLIPLRDLAKAKCYTIQSEY